MTLPGFSGPAGTRILGLGHYRPGNVVTNHDLIARGVDTDDEWIKTRVGIAERRWAEPDETVVDMAEQAASKALAASGVEASSVDLVIVATCTMPTPVPAAAPQPRQPAGHRRAGRVRHQLRLLRLRVRAQRRVRRGAHRPGRSTPSSSRPSGSPAGWT